MSVVLSPTPDKGLVFIPNVAHGQRQTLSVRNDNVDPVAFKVKTTAPKQYCVRPNSGRIEPGQTTSILVQLQQFKGEIPVKCKDKFLILSAAITPDYAQSSVTDFWGAVDSSPDKKSIVKEQKIRCSYAQDDGTGGATTTGEETGAGAPSAIGAGAIAGSPATPKRDEDDRYHTVRNAPVNGSTVSAAPASTINGVDSTPSKANGHYDGVPSSTTAAAAPAYSPPAPQAVSSTPAPAAAPVTAPSSSAVPAAAAGLGAGALAGSAVSRSNGAPTTTAPAAAAAPISGSSTSDLEAKLKAAQEEIAKLKADLAAKTKEAVDARQRERDTQESALRQRKSSTNLRAQQNHADEKYLPAVTKGKPGEAEGVPVQVVAGIAFGVFVFTWLFF